MTKLKTALAPAAASIALAILLASSGTASAQAPLTNGPEGTDSNIVASKAHRTRPLTVRAMPAPAPAPAPVLNPIAGLGTLVAAPFNVIGGAFGSNGPRKGGVTDVRYVGAGAEEAKIDEGFATPVPVDKSGPIYVVENGDPSISPLTFIGAPILAVGSVVQLPFRILGGTLGTAGTY